MASFTEKIKVYGAKSWVRWLLGYLFIAACGVGIVYYWRVIYNFHTFTPLIATAIVVGFFSLVYFLVFLAAHFLKQNFALKGAVLIFIAGLLFVFANPPLQAPDETNHFFRAYSLGSGHFFYDEHEQFPNDVNLLHKNFPGVYNANFPLTEKSSVADAFVGFYADLNANAQAPNVSTNIQQTIPYIPQAIGVALGRFFGANALICLYLARIVNLIFYAILCYFALRYATKFKSILVALMVIPAAIFITSSTSSDAVLLGLTWLFIGICLGEKITTREMLLLAVSFGIMFCAKASYISILPLLLLLPIDKTQRKQYFKIALLFVASIAIFYGLATLHNGLFSNYTKVAYPHDAIRPDLQLPFIFRYPARYVAVFIYTLYREIGNLFGGGTFGWMDIVVDVVKYLSPLVVLVAAAFDMRDGAKENRKTGIVFAITGFLTYAVVYTGMYLTATHYTLPEINGVQTRYLLQAFFVGLALVSMLIGKTAGLQNMQEKQPQKTPPSWRMLHISFLFAVFSAVMLFQSYYIGA